MSNYTPELGQLLNGQPSQTLEPDDNTRTAIDSLRVIYRSYAPKSPSPFDNTGEEHNGKLFTIHAYSWGDEEQPFNLAWRDFRVSWYKYCGRGMSVNRQLTHGEIAEMLIEFMDELRNAK